METKELKLKDVMCGDWVDVRNDASPNTPHIEKITPSHLLRDEHWYGIELTPEILEKNGFRKSVSPPGIHAKCYEIDNKDEKYCLTIANYNKYKRLLLDIDSEDSECFNIKCDYVHQLQHALRLCGIKKEIVLQ